MLLTNHIYYSKQSVLCNTKVINGVLDKTPEKSK